MIERQPANVERKDDESGFRLGDFSVKFFLEIFFRRKRYFLIPLVAVPLLSILVSFLVPSSYMSTTTIMLTKSSILNPLVRFETAVSLQEYNRLGTLKKIIYSRPVIEKVIEELDLDRDVGSPQEHEWLIDDVRKNIHIISLEEDSFELGCTADTPELAKRMVETVSNRFIERSLEGSREEASTAVTFIEKQLVHYENELNEAKAQLKQFEQEHIDTIRRARAIEGDLEKFRERVMETEIELQRAKLQADLLSDRLTNQAAAVASDAFAVQDSPYQNRYRELRLKRAELLSTRESTHPEVEKVDRQMEVVRDLIQEEKKKMQSSSPEDIQSPIRQRTLASLQEARVEQQALQRSLEEYRARAEELRRRVARLPELENRHDRLKTEVANVREVYDSMRMKLEQARISRAVEVQQQENRFSIINPPLAPLSRYQPIRKLYAAAGVLGGLVIGFALVVALEFFDPRLLRASAFAASSGVPLVGSLPRLHRRTPEGADDDTSLRVMIARLFGSVTCWFYGKRVELPESFPEDLLLRPEWLADGSKALPPQEQRALQIMREKIRALNLRIRERCADDSGSIWTLASPASGEGKTLLAANLASVYAVDTGKQAVVLDAHLEQPDLSRLFGAAGKPGLTDLVRGNVSLDQALHETGIPGLSVLPAGGAIDNPGAVFESAEFEDVLRELRDRFTLTVAEVPGLHRQAHGRLLAEKADGVLLVGRYYSTRRDRFRAAASELSAAPLIGCVADGEEYWIPDWIYRWT
ncbi:GumC family protein [Kiritimatiella glycovorans]|uniref:Tyrosine-protein kinase ptk n=1 Tax=Kiritimatiella glycovorans TaxID=1307763 RepID=A0A0G3EBR2_9BACT|nr:hypothetical protein [Kiritimatiella glycovorans]AKJ63896.1 Tyrosine-protein kinase ptk [Kiritimatiella glycovorans]